MTQESTTAEGIVAPAPKWARQRAWHFTPELPLKQAPYFELPFSLVGSLKYLFNIWRPFNQRFLLLMLAIAAWVWFTPSLERARELGQHLEDQRTVVLAQMPLAWSAMSSKFVIHDAIEMQEDALALATRHQLRDVLPYCKGLLAWSVYVGGDYGKSLELNVEALQHERIELDPHLMVLDPQAMALHYRGLHLSYATCEN